MAAHRYLVTARKYRPQRFEELVAQEHVTGTLKNAIRLDRLAHAYLFSGPRGVGKTTAARILAKAINCTTPKEERADEAEPCRACDSCRSFEEGRSLNIIEIDAASNNRVEDIRELRETVRVPPQGSRKKVYIVDEVHMLSNAAFNALLKTLEEPPPYALFIFATTEPHKVLPTILSRCQRFDFRRIPVEQIVAHLRQICTEEVVDADDASLMLIARKGDGALRDALSAFDQAVSLCGTQLTYDELAQAMGVVGVDVFFEVTDAVQARSSADALRLVDGVVRSGYDLQEFLVGLADHFRNLLVARTMEDARLIEATVPVRERYLATSRAFSEPDLLRLLGLVDAAAEALKNSPQPRLKLEMAVLQMATLHRSIDLRAALERLDRLERLAAEGRLPDAGPPARVEASAPDPAAPARPPAPSEAPVQPAAPARAQGAPAEPPAAAPDAAPARPAASATEAPSAPSEETPEPAPEPTASEPAAAPEPTPEPPAPAEPAAPDVPTPALPLFGAPALKKKPPRPESPASDEPAAVFGDSGGVAVAAPPVAVAAGAELQAVRELWPAFVRDVQGDRIHVGALLQHGHPAEWAYGVLHVAIPDDFHERLLSAQADYLLARLEAYDDRLPAPVENLRFIIEAPTEGAAAEASPAATDPKAYLERLREENELVRAIFDEFGGEIAW